MKTVYILRHSIPDKTKYIKLPNELDSNKSISLSKEGIISAKKYFENKIFDNIENVYCSDYKRSYSTARCSNKNVVIDPRLGERVAGNIDYTLMTPLEFFYKQVDDSDYHFNQGESRKEIENRMYDALIDIISKNNNSIVVTHGTALTFLLMKLCDVEFPSKERKIRKISFNNKLIFNDEFRPLETFKLVFDNNKLMDIQYIDFKEYIKK